MEKKKKSIPPEKMMMVWIGAGIMLAIAFIVIGSLFFGLKPAPSAPDSNSDKIDPSLYAPSGY